MVDREQIEALFLLKNGAQLDSDSTGRERIQLMRVHTAFKRKFEFLTLAATVTISASLTLFYPGLVVLLYTSQRGIAWSVAAIAVVMAFVLLNTPAGPDGCDGRVCIIYTDLSARGRSV